MKMGFLVLLGLYWVTFFLIFMPGVSSPISSDYNVTGSFNSSAFQESEVDTGGILGGIFGNIVGIATAGLRFFGMAIFGINLAPTAPSYIQTFLVIWQSFITMLSIGFIISIFWDG